MDIQPIWEGDYNFGPSPWNNPRSYAPNLYEGLGAMPSARAATPSGLSRLRRLRASIASAIAAHFIPAAFGFLAGMMATVGLAYVWALFL